MKRAANRTGILTPATIDDLPLINRWLVLPEIRRWWGSPISNQVEMRLGIRVADEIGRVFLICEANSGPVGLVSLIHTKAMAGSPIGWPEFLPANAWEIGILIADRKVRKRGLGTRALLEAQNLVFTPFDDPVFAWIEKDNEASLACFAKLGYVRANENETASMSSAPLRYDHDDNRPK